MVSNNKSFSVGVQSPTEINAPRGCAVILRRICQLSLTRITHQVSRAFDLNYHRNQSSFNVMSALQKKIKVYFFSFGNCFCPNTSTLLFLILLKNAYPTRQATNSVIGNVHQISETPAIPFITVTATVLFLVRTLFFL